MRQYSSDDYVKPHSITQLLTTNSCVVQLLEQLNHNEKLIVQIRQFLPADLATHVSAAVMQENNLLLWVTGPVWASRLIFNLIKLRTQLPNVQHIKVAVLPEIPELFIVTPQPSIERSLSQHNAEKLLAITKDITDSTLASALVKLASHAKSTITN